MTWINMLSWWQWLIMALVPPLVIMLYFLKLRRIPVEVPSTFLWKRTIEDMHVNSIWQRLRRNLLLLLQLLFLLLLILACLRPGQQGTASTGTRSIILVDRSASMQATDVGPNRLAIAKSKALELVESMESGDVAMVIAFAGTADVRQGFTGDKNRLKRAIEGITPTNETSQIGEALRAASGLSNPGRTSQLDDMADVQTADALPAELYVISDGRFVTPPDFDLGNLAPTFFPVGKPDASNVAIVAFTAERNPERPDQVEAYARIANFSAEAVKVTASLELDGKLLDSTATTIEAGGESGVDFELSNVDAGELKISIDHKDDLSLDNIAFAAIEPPRQLTVLLITEGNTSLEATFRTGQATQMADTRIESPDFLSTPDYEQLTKTGVFDLIIYDNCAPKKNPLANTFYIGKLPPEGNWSAGPSAGPVFIIDTMRQHPIMQYVDLGTVRIVDGQPLTPPEGSTNLITADIGTLMAVSPRGPYQDAVLGMVISKRAEDGSVAVNTDWPIKRSFPVFVLNCVEFLGNAAIGTSARSVLPGEPVALNPGNRWASFRVQAPTGQAKNMSRLEQSQVIFTQTENPGIYRVLPPEGEQPLQRFAVNLFSPSESQIASEPEIMLGAQDVAAEAASPVARFEYWRVLLLLGLALLAVEWIVYNRRILM